MVGRHRVQQLQTAPHDAGRHRPEHLVTGEHVEVAAQVLHVDADVRYRLGAIDDDACASLPGQGADVLGGIDEPQNVGHMAERDQPCLRGDQLLQLIDPQAALVIDIDDAHGRARLLRGARPRQQVGVVFRNREDDLVTRAEIRRPQVLAIRLIPSVEPRVKMISFGLGALMNRATV